MIYLIILAAYLFQYVSVVSSQSYGLMGLCNPELCHRYKNGQWENAQNIGCNNPDEFGEDCPSNAVVQNMDDDLKYFILNMHNTHRNKVANGYLSDFPQASRMATLQWNDELEYLAQLNCLRCYYGADECRNTNNFRHVGQNIDLYWNSTGYWSNEAIIEKIFKTWFREHEDTRADVIKSYYHTGLLIGHFTQIISAKSAYVGCAMIYWTLPHHRHYRYYMYFVCNYSYTNYVGQPVYEEGYAASKCTTGTNYDYSGLCSIDEVFDPVPVWAQDQQNVQDTVTQQSGYSTSASSGYSKQKPASQSSNSNNGNYEVTGGFFYSVPYISKSSSS